MHTDRSRQPDPASVVLTRAQDGVCPSLMSSASFAGAAPFHDAPKPGATDATPTSTDRAPYDPQLARKTVEFWKSSAGRDPAGFLEWRELSAAYLARQRETGDIADAVKAEDAARRSLKISEKRNAQAVIRLGRSLLTQHRFPEALEAAKKAAALDPAANRLVADIQIELGDLEAAETALAANPARGDDLNYLAIRARLDEMGGRPEAALRRWKESCEIADERPDMPAETVAWAYTMLGHTLIDRGRLEEGERACRKALQVFPVDYRAMTGMAEAAVWREDWKSAADWAKKAVNACPQNPEAIRLLAESLSELGDAKGSQEQNDRLASLCRSFPRIYDRHWVMFLADQGRDLDEALALAKKDLELRRDLFGYDALAWVCFKKGALPEAEKAMAKALGHGTQAAPLYYHAGMIAKASGDADRAEAFFSHARKLNPSLMKSVKLD